MTPLSVLRIWGLGIFGWALLGLGIYLAVEAYDEFSSAQVHRVAPAAPITDNRDDKTPAREEVAAAEQPAADRGAQADRVPQTDRVAQADRNAGRLPEPVRAGAERDWKPWALLAGAIACLGLSFFGSWPISFMLGGKETGHGRETGHTYTDVAPTRTLSLDRPDGSKLHVEIYGEANRPTLLLTHGWSLDTSAWKYIKSDLLDRYRLVAWDLPGLGRSHGPANKDYSLEKMADDLDAVLHATLENDSPVILLGHSIGGMILQVFSRVHGDELGRTVKGLILLHTTYTDPLRTITASSLATALEVPVVIPMNYLTIALAPLAWLSNWQSYFNGSLHIWTRLVSFSGKQSRAQIEHGAWLAAKAWPATIARGNLAMFKFDEEATLPHVDVPVLVVAGDHDRVTRPVASHHIERLLPNDRASHIDGGHLGYWEVSESAVELIREFAEQVAPTVSGSAYAAAQALDRADLRAE